MKTLVVLAALLGSSMAFATVRPARCNTENPQQTVTAQILEGDDVSVIVENVNPSTGYTIVFSAEGLEGKFVKTTSAVRPGAGGKMVFKIKGSEQDQTVATYTFEYKRSWEKKHAAATCLVTVIKK